MEDKKTIQVDLTVEETLRVNTAVVIEKQNRHERASSPAGSVDSREWAINDVTHLESAHAKLEKALNKIGDKP